jgi:hypothetical protein
MPAYGQWLRVVLRSLSTTDAAATLADIAAGRTDRCILLWIPLMHGAGDPGIIKEWRRLADMEEDGRVRGEIGGLALVFAQLAGRVPEWRKGLEGWNVGESQIANEWRAEGEVKGVLKTWRASVLGALEVRLGIGPPPDIVRAVEAIDSVEELSRWFKAAVAATSLEAFLSAVRRS